MSTKQTDIYNVLIEDNSLFKFLTDHMQYRPDNRTYVIDARTLRLAPPAARRAFERIREAQTTGE